MFTDTHVCFLMSLFAHNCEYSGWAMFATVAFSYQQETVASDGKVLLLVASGY